MTDSTYTMIKQGRGLLMLSLLVLVGCGPSQQEMMAKDRLENAKKTYTQAKADPNIEANAPVQLEEAGKAVQAAEKAKDAEEMGHLAYVAEKKTQTAVAVAEGKMAEKDLDALNLEKANTLLEKRDREARLSQKQAEAEARRAQELSKVAMEAQKAKAETEQFIRELSDLRAKQTDRGVVLTLGGDVSFATGKASLSPAAARSVDKLAAFMKKYPKRSVVIEGYTDNAGSEKSNLALSQKRADEVKKQLIAKGINSARIAAKGYGVQYPVAGNDTAEGRKQNRRVEVLLLKEGVQPETMIRQ